jgi:hypothetical protein
MGGIAIGDLGTIMCPSGIGKSRCLVHLGKAANLMGHGVIHYSLEMSRRKLLKWYDQMLVGSSEQELTNPNVIHKLVHKSTSLGLLGGHLQVVHLPFGYDTEFKGSKVVALRADFKRRCELFRPSVVLIDYGDLLALGGKRSRYEEQGDVWKMLKKFAEEENVAMWVATQSARAGVGVRRMTELEVGDSYEKVRSSDIFVGFNRNIVYDQKNKKWEEEDIEHNDRIIRLFMIKHRDRADKYEISFACDYGRGLFYDKQGSENLGFLQQAAQAAPPQQKAKRGIVRKVSLDRAS